MAKDKQLQNPTFLDRDISWLFFNQRVLDEASKSKTPLLERLKFLAIFSSNLDEFYRVRIPMLNGMWKLHKKELVEHPITNPKESIYKQAKKIIRKQQKQFGKILVKEILPGLAAEGIILNYGQPLPDFALEELRWYYYVHIAGYIQIIDLQQVKDFFPLNNEIYFYCTTTDEQAYIVHIPSGRIPRFKIIEEEGKTYVFFIDDIIKQFITETETFHKLDKIYSFKVTRDAELNVKEEAGRDLSKDLVKELKKRDFGLATRLLYPYDLPQQELQYALDYLNLKKSNTMTGGKYHNMKDFFAFPIAKPHLSYPKFETATLKTGNIEDSASIFSLLDQGDQLLHTPYQDYDMVLRFFNEAALDPQVTHIYTTVYRLAKDSKIGNALLSAARNGKHVFVFVELKARFDEDNNILWAKRLEKEGVHISYGIPKIKVHAKIALAKRKDRYYGLLSTGNLNENTAKQYTDHSLLTADQDMLQELQTLFTFLKEKRHKNPEDDITFKHLLVAQFNLYQRYLDLLDFEINEAKAGRKAHVRIKLNNLEEESMISKLYAASQAGVQVELIVRGICRLVPQQKGLSENITVKRIVGRFLEHSRIFHFHHAGEDRIFLGSSDWMYRNIFNRIEVCFPVTSDRLKGQLLHYIDLQLADDSSATWIDQQGNNISVEKGKGVNAQEQIRNYLAEM